MRATSSVTPGRCNRMTEREAADEHPSLGIWYGIAAYVLWGLSPLFWNITNEADAFALLIHRTLWALPLLAIAITAMRLWPVVARSYASWRPRLVTATAAVLLAVNWGVFLWAVTNERVVEASLGYFINPLVSVALGVVVLGERLRRTQWIAVGVAACGVLVMTLRVGELPLVALALALSFGFYGLLKKDPSTPRPVVSLFGEVAVLCIPASALLLFGGYFRESGFGTSPGLTAFLVLTGAMTVAPLLLFAAAVRRTALSTIGLLQYIAPTLQFLLGITVFGEELTLDELLGFGLVWAALAIYTIDARRSERTTAMASN